MTEPIGTCCIVLHSHLPWLAHHGSWPVGEEWLYQSWAASYLPVVEVLDRLADEGRRDLLTLGVTPVLAAQLDDPYCLREFHTWLGFWQVRAEGLGAATDPVQRELGSREFRASQHALGDFESRWRHGASPVLRRLVDSGAVELLGGPATHPFQPLLDDRVAAFGLSTGLDDTQLRVGTRPAGIWAPECGYRPGLEDLYADAGVQRFLVDGPTLLGADRTTADAWTVGGTDVVAFGRDLDVTYRVWSPRRGYPGGPWYRDFHTYDHASGFRPARVTSTRTAPEDKAPYDPERAAVAVAEDAADFVSVVRQRLVDLAGGRDGRPALVTVAYDTELFGHWWHEGPAFLEAVLRLLPEAGVRVTTLRGAAEAGHVAGRADLAPGSWGSGKDWRVWVGEQVADLVDAGAAIQKRWLDVVGAHSSDPERRRDLDQLARDALLALSSDWAFMVTKDSAAGYARDRFAGHEAAFHALAGAIDDTGLGRQRDSTALAARQASTDGPFAHLDARLLRRGMDTL
jgi:1,4-alpha-glucan branching enzyme